MSGTDGKARAEPMERSRHAQRARQDRGAETRARLLQAALDVFGRLGFEAASTREIARQADANLAAIVYHFGGKEGLHRAVAEHVTAEIQQRLGPAAARVSEAFAAGALDKPSARRLLQGMAEAHLDTMLGVREAEAWARFIVREQMETSPVLETIIGFMAPVHAILRRLVGVLVDRDPDGDEVGFLVFTLLGQAMVFRVAQPIVLRLTGRDAIATADRALIASLIASNIDRITGVPLEGRP